MNRIKGIVPPMVTPLLDDNQLDHRGLENLIEHIISGGVHGLFILGTTGEAPSLKYSLRVELIKQVCSQVDGRIPVLVGITDASLKESVYIANTSKESGAQAVVVAPPFYFPISDSELFDYYDQLLREVPLPVYLYNQPSLTKKTIEVEIARDLLERPNVVGFKDSSGNMIYFQRLKALLKEYDIPLLCGPEELLVESLFLGGDGGIPGGANVYPTLYVDIYKAMKAGNFEEALKLNQKVFSISNVLYSGGKYGSGGVISGIKSALSHLNICNDYIAKPLGKISREKEKKVKEFLSLDI